MFDERDFDWQAWVLNHTKSEAITEASLLQTLWGGYGELVRISLRGGTATSLILKLVSPPEADKESFSDQRKRRSYAVEQAWYRYGAPRCDDRCRVAQCLAIESIGETSYMLLEDLNTVGFYASPGPWAGQTAAGLRWLANFHALFMGEKIPGLWEQGCYWHLDTRQQEWQNMPSGVLKERAEAFDALLRTANYQTIVHGDAKPPNFCWGDSDRAAAVDFQYVGIGCGIRDVALFLDRSLGKSGCERNAEKWLGFYFETLSQALTERGNGLDTDELVHEWRTLYPVAWTDYRRFMLGWGSASALDPYSERQLALALQSI